MATTSSPKAITIPEPDAIRTCAKNTIDALIARAVQSVTQYIAKELETVATPENVFAKGVVNSVNLSIQKVFSQGLYEAAFAYIERPHDQSVLVENITRVYKAAADSLVRAGWDVTIDMKGIDIGNDEKCPLLTISSAPHDGSKDHVSKVTVINTVKESQKEG